MSILPGSNLPPGLRVLKTLGRGGEGTVYLVAEDADDRSRVLKVFHTPLRKAWAAGLQIYASQVGPNDLGLPPIALWEDQDKILGVTYPFIPLTIVHRRLIMASDRIAQAIYGRLSQRFPARLAHPRWIIGASRLLDRAGRLRNSIGGGLSR